MPLLREDIIRLSNLLVAVWDGADNGLPGGTSDVVLGYLSCEAGNPPAKVAMDAVLTNDCGDLVVWLPAKRNHPIETACLISAC